jgi:probable selenium-dependent hydroxylase accessory protein YqeC
VTASDPTLDLKALGIRAGDRIAIVGAGGKTTLAWRLVRSALAHDMRAIFTTTTRVWQPAPGVFDITHDPTSGAWPDGDWRSMAILTREPPYDRAPVPGAAAHGMPVLQTKCAGLTPEQVCALPAVNALLIVEADGARGLRVKAPGPNEPQMPPCADVVCVVACLDAIGRPLDDRIAHRAGQIGALTGAMPGSMVTASLLAALLAHPGGGLKHAPSGARKIAVLTQQGGAPHPDGRGLAAELVQAGFAQVLLLGSVNAGGERLA